MAEQTTDRSVFLYPDLRVLVERGPDQLSVRDYYRNADFRAEGLVAREIERFLATQRWNETLDRLPAGRTLRETLERLRDGTRIPLTAHNALEQSGFHILFVELTGTCNERCLHCYAGSSPERRERLDRDDCDRLLDDVEEIGFERIQFTGGDPLLCPFLPDLATRVAEMRGPACEIYTNGLILGDSLLDRLEPSRPSFAFSYYSSDSSIHDAITRVPGSQRRTAAAIARCLERGLDVRVSIVVMDENRHTLEASIASLEDMGVSQIGYSRSHAVGRGRFFDGPLEHETRDHAEPPTAHASTPRAEPGGKADGPRRRRSGKLCVQYDGNLSPCIFNRDDVLGNIRERRLVEILRAPRLPAGCHASQRAGCEESLQCVDCRLTHDALRLLPA